MFTNLKLDEKAVQNNLLVYFVRTVVLNWYIYKTVNRCFGHMHLLFCFASGLPLRIQKHVLCLEKNAAEVIGIISL